MKYLGLLSLAIAPALSMSLQAQQKQATATITVTEGTVTMPSYDQSERDVEPPLFANSALGGVYPLTTYRMPLKTTPVMRTYKAIFVENEYLKLTYVPEFGGRFLEMYDKLRKRDVFYKNDVIKPTSLNPRNDWPQEGIELTGPFDMHSPTMHFEPYWSHTVVRQPDGSVALMLGETDPIYGMTVRYTATLHPGVAALQISTFCFNPNTSRMPQMLWTNASFPTTPETRFIYPMTRTVGHNNGMVTDWPMYEGVDYSWDRNNRNMLGIFGIDLYDNFGGGYMFDRDYGVFRYADRRVVQGMKLWTFGHGRDSVSMQDGYTDKAGPYFEAQSGRHVWDGHYEWVEPHQVEQWDEWWIPVAGTKGLSTITRDEAMNLRVEPSASGSRLLVDLSPVRTISHAKLVLRTSTGVLLEQSIELKPDTPIHREVRTKLAPESFHALEVVVLDAKGLPVLSYQAPEPGEKRSEHTPFTLQLEKAEKPLGQMSAEELLFAAEYHEKDLDDAVALSLLDRALEKDTGYSAAHRLKGIILYKQGKLAPAEAELEKAVDRNPYDDEAFYYLSMAQLEGGKSSQAERNLYHIWPHSAYYEVREYELSRMEYLRGNYTGAIAHATEAISRNAKDLSARHLLVMAYRADGRTDDAKVQLAALLAEDPADTAAPAEQMLLTPDASNVRHLKELIGDQSQEALHLAEFYSDLHQWKDAAAILNLEAAKNSDPFGTSAVFYYTLAYDQKQAGNTAAAAEALRKARTSAGIVDRFPYLASSETSLKDAIAADPSDSLARFNLGCLLFSLGRKHEAREQWQAAEQSDPNNFSVQRALGMALAETGDTKQAIVHLEAAVQQNDQHLATVNDLVTLYARAGRFSDERALLNRALAHANSKDDLLLRLLHVDLVQGRYDDAEAIIRDTVFSPRHRDYTLRDEYRALKLAEGAALFRVSKYSEALAFFRAAETPPASLGVDDFSFKSNPRIQYYIGRALEALGRREEAAKEYEKGIKDADLSAGDAPSFSDTNYFVLLSLRRLNRKQEAAELESKFLWTAQAQAAQRESFRQANGHYVLALLASNRGDSVHAKEELERSIHDAPDLLMPYLDLRGDSLGFEKRDN